MCIEIHVGQTNRNYDYFIEIPRNTDTIQAKTIQHGMRNLILDDQDFKIVIDNENWIKKIGENAFSDYKRLRAVTIPGNVIKIGKEAFMGCTGLEEINGLMNVTEIGDYAFSGCTSLTKVHSPSNIKKLGVNIFNDCVFNDCIIWNRKGKGRNNTQRVLVFSPNRQDNNQIPEGVSIIGAGVFSGCRMKSVTIPNSVKAIGDQAFSNCSFLEKVRGFCNVKKQGKNVFKGCSNNIESDGVLVYSPHTNNLQNGTLDLRRIPDSITEIGAGIFSPVAGHKDAMKNIKQVIIPASVIKIRWYAFSGCIQLEKVTWDNDNRFHDYSRTIGGCAFSGCTNLKNVDISNVKEIENAAFEGCTSLKSIQLNGIETIGDYTFFGCTDLEEVMFNDVSRLKKIGNAAFEGCVNLRRFCSNFEGVARMPSNVTEIGRRVFAGCSKLEKNDIKGNPTLCSTSVNKVMPAVAVTKEQQENEHAAKSIVDSILPPLAHGEVSDKNKSRIEEGFVEIIREWMSKPYDWKGKNEIDTVREFCDYSKNLADALEQKGNVQKAVEDILKWGGINQHDNLPQELCDAVRSAAEDPVFLRKNASNQILEDAKTIKQLLERGVKPVIREKSQRNNKRIENKDYRISSWSKIIAAYKPGTYFIYDSRVAIALSDIFLWLNLPCFWTIPDSRNEESGTADSRWNIWAKEQFIGMCQRNRIHHNQNNANISEQEADIPTCYKTYLKLLNALAQNRIIVEEYQKLDKSIRKAYKDKKYTKTQAIMAHLEKVLFMKKDDILAPFKSAEER